jgi:hypothetical protein
MRTPKQYTTSFIYVDRKSRRITDRRPYKDGPRTIITDHAKPGSIVPEAGSREDDKHPIDSSALRSRRPFPFVPGLLHTTSILPPWPAPWVFPSFPLGTPPDTNPTTMLRNTKIKMHQRRLEVRSICHLSANPQPLSSTRSRSDISCLSV